MSLKDCCSTQQMSDSGDTTAAEAMQHADTAILALGRCEPVVLQVAFGFSLQQVCLCGVPFGICF
jgi:hypothetical protein